MPPGAVTVIDLLKDFLRPSDISCVLALLTPGTIMLFVPGLARFGRRWLAAVVLLYLFLSSDLGAGVLARTLDGRYQPITSAAQAPGVHVVVLLGSGSINLRASSRQLSVVSMGAGLRVLEAARLSDLLGGATVIASGGVTERDSAAAPESDALRRALIDVGVPADRIVLESESKNTHDEAVVIKRMLAERGVSDFVLVTSPLHMRRSMLTFEHEGMHPIASPSQLTTDRSAPRSRLAPNDLSLTISDGVVYEWAARAFYWWKGWMR
jgi:uncharacterized SAM-binding protein YcdF (DUF218 family)